MKMIHPLVVGSTGDLREGVEAFLSRDPRPINDRLAQLNDQVTANQKAVSFGAEVECMFLPDPGSPDGERIDRLTLHQEVEFEMNRGFPLETTPYEKGEIVFAYEKSGRLLRSSLMNGTFNSDGNQDEVGITEFRTAPADCLEATERYWDLIDTVGRVAAAYGQLGVIVATHINVVGWDGRSGMSPITYNTGVGRRYLGRLQQTLQSLNPLQFTEGIASGEAVMEAFPSKDASTAVHRYRLELRHHTSGVVDPRVDMLGALSVMSDLDLDNESDQPGKSARSVALVKPRLPDGCDKPLRDMADMLGYHAAYDLASRSFVLGQLISPHNIPDIVWDNGNAAMERLSNGRVTSAFSGNAAGLRGLVGSLSVSKRMTRFVATPSEYLSHEAADVINGAELIFRGISARVAPQIYCDSPDDYRIRRQSWRSSSIARNVLGPAAAAICPPAEAILQRQQLIGDQMIVTE